MTTHGNIRTNNDRSAVVDHLNQAEFYRAFTVKYFGPTYAKGSRVRIIDTRWNVRVFIPYDHAMNNTLEIATAYLMSRGISVDAYSETDSEYILFSKTMLPALKDAPNS